jgi:hypothetical protein
MEDFAFFAVPIQPLTSFYSTQSFSAAWYDHNTLGSASSRSHIFLCVRKPLRPSSHSSWTLHRLHLGSIALLGDFTHDTIRLLRLAIPRTAESGH